MIDAYIEKYGRRLYGLCRSLIGNDADDLYQETWLRAYMKLHTYDEGRPFEAWITGICVNAYRDELRRRRRRGEYEVTVDAEVLSSMPDDSDGFRAAEVRGAVDRLPQKLREAVILYYYNGLDEKATAQALHIPVGTVKSRLSAARNKLKGELLI